MAGCKPVNGTSRPNILFITTDNLNDAISSMGGHPQANTPNIDRLAQNGIIFNRAYSNAPLCAPSRASFLSGILPHSSGYYGSKLEPGKGRNHWKNNTVLRGSKTIMEHFRDNGYHVYGTGKFSIISMRTTRFGKKIILVSSPTGDPGLGMA